ncbi:MalY/PatB family protein [Candidatus Enterococcus mangumiae]|uniref:cysteine-S-conjugate beta-lyase n=1 Tax=Candidatus Enterococcus mangumiae TaxID=2230878 RepID=A0ABZ2T124_9ENTE|nr:MalY/PatB family protein [Enterococcus sp. DIV1094]MBO0491119.1 pyridoxal phosphate-dependent aminotransferase [Enterococcus sp. DIV1094]
MDHFDEFISRKNTDSVKWDAISQTYHMDDLLPLWVADMDFLAPQGVIDAFENYLQKGIFGYSIVPDGLYRSVVDWEQKHHHVTLTKNDVLFTSGVLVSLSMALQAFTAPGDAVLIHDPVYPPFGAIVEKNERQLIRSSLNKRAGHFEMDFQDMEEKIISKKIKAIILCNPHNPGGRVWTKKELKQLSDLCLKYDVFLFSDEIHQDIVFSGHEFTSMQTIDPTLSRLLITFTSATKTFNLAAIKNSMVFIKDPDLKNRFIKQLEKNQHQGINTFGLLGTQAAYETGEEWLKELLVYLEENVEEVITFFAEHLPDVEVMKPEGTYLMWLDFSAYTQDDRLLEKQLIKKGKVVLNPGISFGPSGHSHMRLNVACPKSVLREGLLRIKRSFID